MKLTWTIVARSAAQRYASRPRVARTILLPNRHADTQNATNSVSPTKPCSARIDTQMLCESHTRVGSGAQRAKASGWNAWKPPPTIGLSLAIFQPNCQEFSRAVAELSYSKVWIVLILSHQASGMIARNIGTRARRRIPTKNFLFPFNQNAAAIANRARKPPREYEPSMAMNTSAMQMPNTHFRAGRGVCSCSH